MATVEDSETHFVANLLIETIDRVPIKLPAGSTSYRGAAETVPTERRVTELTRIVVKAKDLGDLKKRLGAHISLIEED